MCLDLSICAFLSIYLSVGLTFSESQKQVTNLENGPSALVPLAPMTLSHRVVTLTRSRSNSERFVREQQATRVFCLFLCVCFLGGGGGGGGEGCSWVFQLLAFHFCFTV